MTDDPRSRRIASGTVSRCGNGGKTAACTPSRFITPSVTHLPRSDAVVRLVFIFQLPPMNGLRSDIVRGYP